MFKKCWFVVGLVALMSLAGNRIVLGQETPDPVIDPLHARVSSFLERISQGSTQAAFQEILGGSQLFKQTAAIEALIQRTGELSDRYGEYRAFEQIAAKRVGSDLVLLKYLYKCEDFPVVWYFTFYRTPPRGDLTSDGVGSWRVITVRFDTELELLGLQDTRSFQ